MKKILMFVAGVLSVAALLFSFNAVKTFKMVEGKFYQSFVAADAADKKDTYYQFRSNDNEVFWALTVSDIGEIPSLTDEYILIYSDLGTTEKNKPCDCSPELDCECEVYDYVLVRVFKNNWLA